MDVATYLLDRPGTYSLTEISVSWFDSRANRCPVALSMATKLCVSFLPFAVVLMMGAWCARFQRFRGEGRVTKARTVHRGQR